MHRAVILASVAIGLAFATLAVAADPPVEEGFYAPPGFEPVSYFAPFGNCCGSTLKCKNWWAVPAGAHHLAFSGYCGECNFQQPLGGCEDCDSWTPFLTLSRLGARRRCGGCGCESCRGGCDGACGNSCSSKPTCGCASKPSCTCASRPTCPANCTASCTATCPATCDSRPVAPSEIPLKLPVRVNPDPFRDDPPPAIPSEPAPMPPMPLIPPEPVLPMTTPSSVLRRDRVDRSAAAPAMRGVAPVGYAQSAEPQQNPNIHWVADEAPATSQSQRMDTATAAPTVLPATLRESSRRIRPIAEQKPTAVAEPQGNTLRFR